MRTPVLDRRPGPDPYTAAVVLATGTVAALTTATLLLAAREVVLHLHRNEAP